MNLKLIYFILLFAFPKILFGQISVIDAESKTPISYATISFGNGNGIFADDNGSFIFTKKLYSDIDTLYISALGFKEYKIATNNIPQSIPLHTQMSELQEIVLKYKPKGKYKVETLKPTLHEDYFKCWLPTIESEIAVFFPKNNPKPQKIAKVLLPIKVESKDWNKRKRATSEKRPFSTLFRATFYANNNGFPGETLTYDDIIFIINEKSEKIFELDVSSYDLFMPKNGVFVSIQVLGYTDKQGKLLPNKKYREVKTKRGIVKVSTTFRPLLPFTDEIIGSKTFVKRIFLNNNEWIVFNRKNVPSSNLLKSGLNNYGMGLAFQVYKNDKQ